MNRFMGVLWSLLFLMVPILGVGVFLFAIMGVGPLYDHWLPININRHGHVIDDLFMFILWLTGIIFVGTSFALFLFMWKYDAAKNQKPVVFSHGSHTLEIIWSIIPAVVLFFIAIYQMNAWADAKMRRPTEIINGEEVAQAPLAEVTGRQFEWRIRYAGFDGVLGTGPGTDGEMGTADDTRDDLFVVNELHLPMDEEVVLAIKSQDVLHSFFLPNMRIKQDLVPGMLQYVWFEATQPGTYDIVCAELCGWGHYKMRGRMIVHETREEYEAWLVEEYRKQQSLPSVDNE
ncbi:MAG: cytochrome c oxidase subunit II [bacterium]|nr:cytochrome c oxidase subunit II [bacterium]